MAYEEILTTSGGTMQGPLKWNSTSLEQFSGAPSYLLGIDSFSDGGQQKWQSASSVSVGTASKLGTSTLGSATQPIYLNGGTPTKCTYTLGASVPSGAKFTDTTYSAGLGIKKIDNTFNTTSLIYSDTNLISNINTVFDEIEEITSYESSGQTLAFLIATNQQIPRQDLDSSNSLFVTGVFKITWIDSNNLKFDGTDVNLGQRISFKMNKTGSFSEWKIYSDSSVITIPLSWDSTIGDWTELTEDVYKLIKYSIQAKTPIALSISGDWINNPDLSTTEYILYYSLYNNNQAIFTTVETVDHCLIYAILDIENGLIISVDSDPLVEEIPTATTDRYGKVKIGSNLTISNGILSLSKENVTSALNYTPCRSWTVTIPSGSSGSKSITVSGASFSKSPLITKSSGSDTDYNKITAVSASTNNLTFTLSSATSAALTLTVIETF